jgi:hypothetical protein
LRPRGILGVLVMLEPVRLNGVDKTTEGSANIGGVEKDVPVGEVARAALKPRNRVVVRLGEDSEGAVSKLALASLKQALGFIKSKKAADPDPAARHVAGLFSPIGCFFVLVSYAKSCHLIIPFLFVVIEILYTPFQVVPLQNHCKGYRL